MILLNKPGSSRFFDAEGAGAGAGGGTGGSGGEGGKGVFGQGGDPTGDVFHDMLPEEFRTHPSLKDIKDIGGLAKGYIHAQSLVGKNKVAIPGDKATPEEMAAYYKALGRPDKSDDYGLDAKVLPEGLMGKDEIFAWAKTAFHDMGLSSKQAQSLYKGYAELLTKQVQAMTKEKTDNALKVVQDLKTEWGQAFNQNIAIIKNLTTKHGSPEFTKYLDDSGLGNNADFAKMLLKLAKVTSNDSFETGSGSGGFAMTPEEAKAKIKELESDPEFLKRFQSLDSKVRQGAIEERRRYFAVAFPEGAGIAA